MATNTRQVPPGPYFHGPRIVLPVDAALRRGTVNPAEGDDRLVVWATTEVDDALNWANRGYTPPGSILYVYEVDLVDVRFDINFPPEKSTTDAVSVMGSSGTVLRLVQQVPAAHFAR